MSALAWVAGAALLAPFAAAAAVPLMQDAADHRRTRREAQWLAEYHHGPASIHDLMDQLTEEQHA